jgi:hypothetical protein
LAGHKLDFPVYTNLSEETRSAYRLGSTPETIVVDTDGKVIHAWVGAFTGSTKREIERFFSIHLPSLS